MFLSTAIKDLLGDIPNVRCIVDASSDLIISSIGLLPVNGGTIVLSSGSHIMDNTANLWRSNIMMVGYGIENTLLIRKDSNTNATIGNPANKSLDNIVLQYFALNCSKFQGDYPTGFDISFANSLSQVIKNLIIDGISVFDSYWGIGIYGRTGYLQENPTIRNCIFSGFGIEDVQEGKISLYMTEGALICNNQISSFYNTGMGAIDLSACINSIVEHNIVKDCIGGGTAIEVEANSDGAIVRYNETIDNSGPGYAAAACAGNKADNILFLQNTSIRDEIGIVLTGTSVSQIIKHFILRKNIIADPLRIGINIPNWVQDVLIEDNNISTLLGTDKTGIFISQSDEITIMGGVIDGFDIGMDIQPTVTNISLGSASNPVVIKNAVVGIYNRTGSPIDVSSVTFINCGTNVIG